LCPFQFVDALPTVEDNGSAADIGYLFEICGYDQYRCTAGYHFIAECVDLGFCTNIDTGRRIFANE